MFHYKTICNEYACVRSVRGLARPPAYFEEIASVVLCEICESFGIKLCK